SPAGGGARSLSAIAAPLDIHGGSTDRVTIDDSGSGAAETGTLAGGVLSGLGMPAPGSIAVGSAATTLVLGGSDTLSVEAEPVPIVVHVPGDFAGQLLASAAALQSVTIDGSLTPSGVVKVGGLGSFATGGDLSGLVTAGTIGSMAVGGNLSGTISAPTIGSV